MSDFPITPQQDYLTLSNTTGKGFKQSILLSEINVSGLTPITNPTGAYISGTPVVNNDLTFDGITVTANRPGLLEASIALQLNVPVLAGTNILVLGVHNAEYEYHYVYGLSSSTRVYQKFIYDCTPGETLLLFTSKGDSQVSTITPLSYNIRLY
jgi:hypothetical protein